MRIKRYILLLLIGLLSVTLIGCHDKKSYNEDFTVIFYTGLGTNNVTPTKIESLIGMKEGDYVTKPADPTVEGATFLGWYSDQKLTDLWVFETDTITGSTVLYAKWDIHNLNITYEFDAAGGEFTGAYFDTYTVISTQILPKAYREGSDFKGWIFTPIDEYKVGDVVILTTETLTSDITLYALFENKEYTVSFRALLDGVRNPTIHVVDYATEMDFPVLTDTDTKHFVGWFSKDGTETSDWGFQYINGEVFLGKAVSYDEGTQEWTFAAQNIIVYAKWEDK